MKPRPAVFAGDFTQGVRLAFRAAGTLAKTPSLWPYILLPTLIGLICYLTLGAVLLFWGLPWLHHLIQAAPESAAWWNWLVTALRWFALIAATVLAFGIFLLTFSTVTLLCALPFFDLLADRFERETYQVEFKPANWKGSLHYNFTLAVNSLRINLKGIAWGILLLPVSLLVPGGFLLTAPIVGYYLALGGVLYASEHRRRSYQDLHARLPGSRGLICGMGTVICLGMSIPFTAVLLLPVSIVAGIQIYNEYLLPRSEDFSNQFLK